MNLQKYLMTNWKSVFPEDAEDRIPQMRSLQAEHFASLKDQLQALSSDLLLMRSEIVDLEARLKRRTTLESFMQNSFQKLIEVCKLFDMDADCNFRDQLEQNYMSNIKFREKLTNEINVGFNLSEISKPADVSMSPKTHIIANSSSGKECHESENSRTIDKHCSSNMSVAGVVEVGYRDDSNFLIASNGSNSCPSDKRFCSEPKIDSNNEEINPAYHESSSSLPSIESFALQQSTITNQPNICSSSNSSNSNNNNSNAINSENSCASGSANVIKSDSYYPINPDVNWMIEQQNYQKFNSSSSMDPNDYEVNLINNDKKIFFKKEKKNYSPELKISPSLVDKPIYSPGRPPNSGNNEGIFNCQVCFKSYASGPLLAQHMLSHSTERPFICLSCGRGFRHKAQKITHERIHTGVRPFGCSICGKLFRQQSHVIQHLKVHSGEKPHICPKCCKSFRQKSALDKHIARECRSRKNANTKLSDGQMLWYGLSIPSSKNDVNVSSDDHQITKNHFPGSPPIMSSNSFKRNSYKKFNHVNSEVHLSSENQIYKYPSQCLSGSSSSLH